MRDVAFLIALTILLCGCSSVPLTEEEQLDQDYKMQLIYDKWIECKAIYKANQYIWNSTFYMWPGVRKGKTMPKYHEMSFDLGDNGCLQLVGDWTWEREEES